MMTTTLTDPALLAPALRLAGAGLFGLALAHLAFPRRFRWREETARMSLLNREIFYVHIAFVCLTVVMMGALSLFAPGALLEPTRLGRWVSAGFAAFWAARLGTQFFGYSAELWRGRPFETFVHVAFSLLWTGLTLLYTLCFLHQLYPPTA